MKRSRAAVTAALMAVLVAGSLTACRGSTEAVGDDEHQVSLSKVMVQGKDVYQVTLSAHAVRRLDIHIAKVLAAPAAQPRARTAVPYAAVVYDDDGSTWAYTVVKPDKNMYLRAKIAVDAIVGSTAYLTSGPSVGTSVVVQGAPELLGAEYQISGEE